MSETTARYPADFLLESGCPNINIIVLNKRKNIFGQRWILQIKTIVGCEGDEK